MFRLSADLSVYLHREPIDFRAGINSQFSDTVAGAGASAVIYSLVLTCRACGVDPYDWLNHVLAELPQRGANDGIDDLLPFNFAHKPDSVAGNTS